MPAYTFECDQCHLQLDVFMTLTELERCGAPECAEHGPMDYVWEPRKHKPFPAFTTTHVDGKPMEITSLHQIRKLEKEREGRKFCWEPGSYDSRYGAD